jgi:hypothetical protein
VRVVALGQADLPFKETYRMSEITIPKPGKNGHYRVCLSRHTKRIKVAHDV